jgi:hypothetical protein
MAKRTLQTIGGDVVNGIIRKIRGVTPSSFFLTLVDDTDASTLRTTLGLGTVATLASDTDGTLAANSDSRVATQKAVKTYVDGIITGGASDVMIFKGVIDCSANPNYPAADAGHTYKVSVAGKIGGGSGPNVEAGDTLYCITDSTASGTHAGVGANWVIAQVNVDGAYFAGGTDVAVADGGTGAGDAATARTNLAVPGLATANTFTDVQTFDKAKRLKVITLTDAATVAVDASAGDAFYLSTANSRAFGVPTNAPAAGYTQLITVTVYNSSGGSITPTLTTSGAGCWRYGTTVTALPAIAAGKSMSFTAKWHQVDSNWDVLGKAEDF